MASKIEKSSGPRARKTGTAKAATAGRLQVMVYPTSDEKGTIVSHVAKLKKQDPAVSLSSFLIESALIRIRDHKGIMLVAKDLRRFRVQIPDELRDAERSFRDDLAKEK